MNPMTRSPLVLVCERLKIRADVKYGNDEPMDDTDSKDADWRRSANPWTVTLKMGKRRLTVPFWTGSALTSEPTPADVLSCLVSDARSGEMSFSEFCSEFGYDTDSRRAERTHAACAKFAPRVRRFLGDAFDDVASAEH